VSKYLAESYDKALRENAALRQENERLVAANKARAEYLTTRRAGNDVDSYVNLAEAEVSNERLGAIIDSQAVIDDEKSRRLAEAVALLRDLASRPRHRQFGAYEVRMWPEDFDRIDAFLAKEKP
jgi:hypothetical protein